MRLKALFWLIVYIAIFSTGFVSEYDYFDALFISFVFHGFTQENREKIIKNAYKVLKPGGVFAILDFSEFDVEKSPFYIRLPMKFLECPLAIDFINRDLEDMLSKHGFSGVSTNYYMRGHIRLFKAKKILLCKQLH